MNSQPSSFEIAQMEDFVPLRVNVLVAGVSDQTVKTIEPELSLIRDSQNYRDLLMAITMTKQVQFA